MHVRNPDALIEHIQGLLAETRLAGQVSVTLHLWQRQPGMWATSREWDVVTSSRPVANAAWISSVTVTHDADARMVVRSLGVTT